MTFREWLATLTPHREHTAGEDIADTIGLIVIMALVVSVVFL